MNIIKNYFLVCIVLFLCTACLDEIELEPVERPKEGYVVQGKLVLGAPSYAEVKVEKLFVYTSNINQLVQDAEVRLVAATGEEYNFPSNQLDGIYSAFLTQADFPVTVGNTYRIEVMLTDGSNIISDWETIEAVPSPTHLKWALEPIEVESVGGILSRRPGIRFGIDSPLSAIAGTKARLRWEFIDAYKIVDNLSLTCYVENPYQSGKVLLVDGNTISGDELLNFPLFTAGIDQRHIDGYYLSVFQQALSPAAFSYWSEVASLLDREGTVFDNPAGMISTNLKNTSDSTALIHGFFSAYSQDTLRLFISRQEMGDLPYYCPRPPVNNAPPPITICDNCIDALGASYEKPPYWE